MAVIVADDNATIATSCAAEVPLAFSTPEWFPAHLGSVLLVRVEDCCGVLQELADAAVPPIAHIGTSWAFFVGPGSVAELYERDRREIDSTPIVVCHVVDAGLLPAFVSDEPIWIIAPQDCSGRPTEAREVLMATQRALRNQKRV